jgi:hypothetical protein
LAEYITGLQPSEPVIPYNRFELWKILVKAGMTPQNLLNAPADYRLENPLRHVRITHLVSHYGMTDEETRKFIGWAMSSPWGSRTQASYEHTNWQAYIDKLLKPLPSIEPVSLARP